MNAYLSPGPCVRELRHEWDPVSGWCLAGCGWRQDGKSAYRSPRPSIDVPDVTEPRRAVDA